jgi:alkaline phosphatase
MKLILIFLVALTFSACNIPSSNISDDKGVRNIILLIGDGMGDAQLYAAMTQFGSPLHLEQFPYSGFQKTFSLVNYITDSAAAGTALATGNKTKNGIISQDTLGNNYQSILRIAQANGLSTGVISTSSLTHATPASFYANQPSRNMQEEIAYDLMKSNIDVFIGGGSKFFSERKDGLNLLDSLKNKGYTVTSTMDEVNSFTSGKLAGFTAENHNPKFSDGRGDMLSDAAAKAIEILSKNENGFFLIIEGSMIDWGGHDNDMQYVIDETLDFDRAVGKALAFAQKDGNTLVVATSDHETGGMTIVGGNQLSKELEVNFSSTNHSADMVPVFSYGPGAEKFSGIIDNTEFFTHFMDLYGFSK